MGGISDWMSGMGDWMGGLRREDMKTI
jgi:hypothetical protein